ncbi:MAG: hypothetical protein WA121_07375 [Syntrophales bacterium]
MLTTTTPQTGVEEKSSELAAFCSWFIEFDAAEWDRQIETDSETGKLDRLAQNAMNEHKAGKTKASKIIR